MLKILFTGGGSGGHIYPLVAVAEEITRQALSSNVDIAFDYLGDSGEFSIVLENSGMTVHAIAGGKFRNYFSVKNYLDFFKIGFSILQAFFKMYLLMPDVVFSKGGTGALPVVFAARFYRIPVLIHDSDAIPGKTNEISAWFASRIAISFAGAFRFFNKNRTALVGNLIRSEFFAPSADKNILREKLGFRANLPFILILGSSQGATRINDFIFSVVPSMVKRFQILHQVGMNNITSAEAERNAILKDLSGEEKTRYQITPFLEDDYAAAVKAADLIVSRASSGAIFEIAAAGKPAILIPLPESAQDHQRENAYEYASTGAAIIIEQENLLPSIFFEQVLKVFDDTNIQQTMSEAASKFAKPNAAKIVAEEIINLAS